MSGDWSNKVVIVLHHVPESEDYEGGFEAVTMSGVPHDVSVTGSDRDSAEAALDHLLAGLREFGFSGRVAIHDATSAGRTERYEIEAL